jgi:hypothetical protein
MSLSQNRWHTQDPVSSEGTRLEAGLKQLRAAYYSGGRMPSPHDGFLEPIGVRSESDGGGVVLLECSVSSLRYELRIPKASTDERAIVRTQQEAGQDPDCPRHVTPSKRLVRSGVHLTCPACGVRFGRAD